MPLAHPIRLMLPTARLRRPRWRLMALVSVCGASPNLLLHLVLDWRQEQRVSLLIRSEQQCHRQEKPTLAQQVQEMEAVAAWLQQQATTAVVHGCLSVRVARPRLSLMARGDADQNYSTAVCILREQIQTTGSTYMHRTCPVPAASFLPRPKANPPSTRTAHNHFYVCRAGCSRYEHTHAHHARG